VDGEGERDRVGGGRGRVAEGPGVGGTTESGNKDQVGGLGGKTRGGWIGDGGGLYR
jgi:hypothetical protein